MQGYKDARIHWAACFSLLCLLASGFIPRADAELLPLPAGFAEQVEKGWLPPLNVRPEASQAPRSGLPVWVSPDARNEADVLFLCDSHLQYEVVELCRSFNLRGRVIPVWFACSWTRRALDPDNENLLRYYLGKSPPDAIVVAGLHTDALAPDIQSKIVEPVQSGTGLLWALPGLFLRIPDRMPEPSPLIDPLLPLVVDRSKHGPLSRSVKATGNHPLTAGVPFDQMRWCTDGDSLLRPGATSLCAAEIPYRSLAACWERGKGRVISYNRTYAEFNYNYPFLPVPFPIEYTASAQAPRVSRWLIGDEFANAFYLWLGKAILWVAHKEPTLVGKDAVIPKSRAERESLLMAELRVDSKVYGPTDQIPVTVTLRSKRNSETTTKVLVELFDTDGRLLATSSSSVKLPPNVEVEVRINLDIAACPCSTRLANLRARVDASGDLIELKDQLFIRQPENWDDVHIVGYGGISWYCAPFDWVYQQQLKAMGFDTLLQGFLTPTRLRFMTESGLRPLPNNVSLTGAAATAQMCAPFSPVSFELQDEPEIATQPSPEAGWNDPGSLRPLRTGYA